MIIDIFFTIILKYFNFLDIPSDECVILTYKNFKIYSIYILYFFG